MGVGTGRAEPLPETAPAPAPVKKSSFNVMEYRIEGNTMLSATRIEEVMYPFLGEDKTIADVKAAQSALQAAYSDAGFLTVLVDIPEQTIKSGIVRLSVTEGKVSKTRVVGSRYYDLGRILAKVPELAEGSVPYFPGLQKEMADSNSVPGLKVTPVLRPGITPGSVEADLRVDDNLPLHGSVELNNYSSPNTQPLRVIGMLKYDNLWQQEHSMSLQYQTAPKDPSEVKVISGTYLIPLGSSGNQLALYVVSSHSNVAAVGDTTLLGQGDIFGARWVLPVASGPGFYHSITLGVDYKNFNNDTVLSGADTGHTPISYIPFSVAYSGTMQDGKGGASDINATINFKLRGVGDQLTDCNGQMTSQFECMRYDATPDYMYLRAGIDHTEPVFWGMSIFTRVDGQITSGPLISNEQFVAGGVDSVRGYYTAEQAGDNGLRGSLEVRGPQWGGGTLNDLHVLAFADGAKLTVVNPLPSQTASFNLSSVGFGLRAQASNANLTLDVARPCRETQYTTAGRIRVEFKANVSF